MGKVKEIFNEEFFYKYKTRRLPINLFILSVLFFFGCFFDWSTYIVFPLLFVMVCFDDVKNGFTYVVYSFPFIFMDVYISVVLFFICYFVVVFKYYFLTYFKNFDKTKFDKKFLILIAIFFIYCLLPIGAYNLNKLIRIMLFAVIFLFLGMFIKGKDILRLKYNLRILTISLGVACIFGLTAYISPHIRGMIEFTFGRYQALFYQTNVLAMICEIMSSIFAYYIISGKASYKEYICLVAVSIMGLTTMSKTFLILMSIIYLSLFIYLLKKNTRLALMIISFLVVVVGIVIILGFDYVSDYLNRFSGGHKSFENLEDFLNIITTDRYFLWTIYFGDWVSNPINMFLGVGLGCPSIDGRGLSPHNLYLAMFYELGFVGGIIFCSIILSLLIKIFMKSQINKWAISVPAVVFTLLFMVEDTIFYIFS